MIDFLYGWGLRTMNVELFLFDCFVYVVKILLVVLFVTGGRML